MRTVVRAPLPAVRKRTTDNGPRTTDHGQRTTEWRGIVDEAATRDGERCENGRGKRTLRLSILDAAVPVARSDRPDARQDDLRGARGSRHRSPDSPRAGPRQASQPPRIGPLSIPLRG